MANAERLDLLILNNIGGGFTRASAAKGIGGSELEIVQLAHGLADRGYRVVVANGVEEEIVEDGVTYMPWQKVPTLRAKVGTLMLERTTSGRGLDFSLRPERTVVRANDVYFEGYEVHRELFEVYKAKLIANTAWQASLFDKLVPKAQQVVINPMLGPTPPTEKVPGLFVYASMPMKGLEPTLAAWRAIKRHHPRLARARLDIVTPGHFGFYGDKMPELSAEDAALGISYRGSPTIEEYRRTIASAEGMFLVSAMTETFCVAAALAERALTRPHILCLNGEGGIPEALSRPLWLTQEPETFERQFVDWFGEEWARELPKIKDRSPQAMLPEWEAALGLLDRKYAGGAVGPIGSAHAPIQPAGANGPAGRLPKDATDLLIIDSIGPAYGNWSLNDGGVGGSEFEVIRIAHGLAAKGYRVVVANGVQGNSGIQEPPGHGSVAYIPSREALNVRARALYLVRATAAPPECVANAERIVVRVTDNFVPAYNVHKSILTYKTKFAFVSRWQAVQDKWQELVPPGAGIVVSPLLDPAPEGTKVPGLFVYASAPVKGLTASLELWREMKRRMPHPRLKTEAQQKLLRDARLVLALPGQSTHFKEFDQYREALTGEDLERFNISYAKPLSTAQYVELIASAEGLWYVNSGITETFGSVAALAERSGTRTHILCEKGPGGLKEALVDHSWLTSDVSDFEQDFVEALGTVWPPPAVPDRSLEAMLPKWEELLFGRISEVGAFSEKRLQDAVSRVERLTPERVAAANAGAAEQEVSGGFDRELTDLVPANFAPVLAAAPPPNGAISAEYAFPADPSLNANKAHLGPLFGDFLSLLRASVAPGGSEFGLGLSLFSLAASIRATNIVEIGRFKGFSTLALAAACKLQDVGWADSKLGMQRPDVDYQALLNPRTPRRVISVDPYPTKEADELLAAAGLTEYVIKADRPSNKVDISGNIDLLFLDGSHLKGDVRDDVARFVPWVRPGGYFVLHDYFGWFRPDGSNGSAIAEVIAEDLAGFDRILIDTGMASLAVFRKAKAMTEPCDLEVKPERVPPRADGRPTVGLVAIAKGDEASTVIARAIASIKHQVDCVTVVCDASKEVAQVCKLLGADVYIRQTRPIDYNTGVGHITAARNDALAIAERRTDYVLMVDPDDYFEGALPNPLDCDLYEVTVHDGGVRYPRAQLWRSGMGYRYEGIAHESLTANTSKIGRATSLIYHRGKSAYGYQDQNPPAVKYSEHATWLKKWLVDHPDDARHTFYLAKSYRDAGRPDEAIAAFEERIAITSERNPGQWDEERFASAFDIGQIHAEQGKDPTVAWLRASEMRPARAEPLLRLAVWHREKQHLSTAYIFAQQAAARPMPADGLFLAPSVYQYEALAEYGAISYFTGQKEQALKIFAEVLPRCPPDRKQWAEKLMETIQGELAREQAAASSGRSTHPGP